MYESENGLIICGKQGTGKTRLAIKIAANHLTEKIYNCEAGQCDLKPQEHKKYHLIIVNDITKMEHFAQVCNAVPPVHRHKIVIVSYIDAEQLKVVNYIKDSFTIITLNSVV